MEIEITLKNYRCFADSKPARFVLRKGLTGFVGVNNAGKSSILKFFYEFRSLFHLLSSPSDNLLTALSGNLRGFGSPTSIFDENELFYDGNSRELELRFRLSGEDAPVQQGVAPAAMQAVVTIPRGTTSFRIALDPVQAALQGKRLDFQGTVVRATDTMTDTRIADLASLFGMFRTLDNTIYIGPFRNAINLGANQNYFDIQVGQSIINA